MIKKTHKTHLIITQVYNFRLTWISVQLEEFPQQLLKLGADFTHRGACCHREMVQPRVL